MPTAVITKQVLIQILTTIKNIINIFFDDLCTIIKAIVLTALVYVIYNKFTEMEKTTQYLIKMDHMRQNEWEKMMQAQSKICTELKKEFDNKINIYKTDTDNKIKKLKRGLKNILQE